MTPGEDKTPVAVTYRWTCPLCQVSKVGIAAAREKWQTKALESMKTHIRSQADERHGSVHLLPDGLEDDAMMGSIEMLEPRSDRGDVG